MSSTSGQSTLFAPSHRKRSDDERFKLTAKQYLDRYHIQVYLQDAVKTVLNSREERPMEAMLKYFNDVLQGNHVLLREFEFVNATPRNRLALIRNFVETYRANPPAHGIEYTRGADWELKVDDHYQDFPPTFHDEARLYMAPNPDGACTYGAISAYFQVLFVFSEFMAAVKRVFEASNAADKALPRVNLLWAVRNIINTKHWDFSCPAASLLDSVLPPPSSGADSAKEATVSYAHFLQGMTRCESIVIAPPALARQNSAAKQ